MTLTNIDSVKEQYGYASFYLRTSALRLDTAVRAVKTKSKVLRQHERPVGGSRGFLIGTNERTERILSLH